MTFFQSEPRTMLQFLLPVWARSVVQTKHWLHTSVILQISFSSIFTIPPSWFFIVKNIIIIFTNRLKCVTFSFTTNACSCLIYAMSCSDKEIIFLNLYFLTGVMANCPPPRPKPNKTDCSKGTRICLAGECTGSICQKHDLEECFLTSAHGANADVMCELACQERGIHFILTCF